jgi:HAMP domain-containing protein
MAQESSSSVDVRISSPLTLRLRGMSLRGKIAGTFTGIIVSVGLLVIGMVYHRVGTALHYQLDQRAKAIATTLTDTASGFIMGRNVLELNALIAKYALLDGIAYVFIEDTKGNVIANSLGVLPPELKPSSSQALRETAESSLTLRGRPVQETRVPILGGRVGAAHVGIWVDETEAEIRRVLFPTIALIAGAVVMGIVVSIFLAQRIIRPVLGLTAAADKISKGNLDTPITVQSADEIGELARSLERMRTSLKAAMTRLSRA